MFSFRWLGLSLALGLCACAHSGGYRPPTLPPGSPSPYSRAPVQPGAISSANVAPNAQPTPLPKTRLTPPPVAAAPAGKPTASQPASTPPGNPGPPAATTARPPIPADTTGGYLIKPQDVLSVSLRGIPEPSDLEDIVDEEGYINMPYIGRIQAADKTSSELERTIQRTYLDQQYYRQITVNVVIPSQSYYVRGEVKNPGRFPLISGVTVMQAVTAAGGYTEYAKPEKTQITREGRSRFINLRQIEKHPEKDEPVKSGDVINVNRSMW